jgi:hypothetical protein
MKNDRRAILALLTLGRITPAEAERLLFACSDARETAWFFTGCIVLALAAQVRPQPWFQALAPAQYTLSLVIHALTHLFGGIL